MQLVRKRSINSRREAAWSQVPLIVENRALNLSASHGTDVPKYCVLRQ